MTPEEIEILQKMQKYRASAFRGLSRQMRNSVRIMMELKDNDLDIGFNEKTAAEIRVSMNQAFKHVLNAANVVGSLEVLFTDTTKRTERVLGIAPKRKKKSKKRK